MEQVLRILALTCLLAAAAAQSTFNCNSNTPAVIREPEFYLITRRGQEFPRGTICEFNAESSTNAFFVEIRSFQVSTAVLTISSAGRTLFRGSSLLKFQSSIATPSRSLKVRFDASRDYSNSAGVILRVRAFGVNGCPPGWVSLYNNCFGTSNETSNLDYFDAQKACNSMRSNLLHLPGTVAGSLGSFVRLLPSHLKSYYTWVGLTDRSGQYRPFWLNGDRQNSSSDIRCASGGSYLTCEADERCSTISLMFNDFMFMSPCSDKRGYACSMPLGGTSSFYQVPDGHYASTVRPTVTAAGASTSRWNWAIASSGLLVVSFMAVGVCRARDTRRATRDAASASSDQFPPAFFNHETQTASQNTQQTPPDYTQQTPPEYTEPTPPEYTEPTPPEYTEPTPPEYTEPTPPEYTEPTPPEYTLQTPPEYTLQTPPEYTQQTPPEYTQQTPPEYTQQTPPEYTQQTPPAQQTPPGYTQETPSEYIQQTPPEYTQQTPPEYTQQTPQGYTQQTALQNPLQNPFQNPLQNPFDNPLQNSFQNPLQNPFQNPLQNPFLNPLQNPLRHPLENPLRHPLENPLRHPLENPLQNQQSSMPQASATRGGVSFQISKY